jgi:hypothetical protein
MPSRAVEKNFFIKDLRLKVVLIIFSGYKPDRGRHPADASGPDLFGAPDGQEGKNFNSL